MYPAFYAGQTSLNPFRVLHCIKRGDNEKTWGQQIKNQKNNPERG